MSKKEVRFQEYSFDRELGGRKPIDELLNVFSKEDLQDGRGFMYGFQIKRFRTGYKKDTPEWAKTYGGVQKVLLTAFPRLHTSLNQRRRAARWAQIIYLFYFKDFSESQIAEELNIKIRAVPDVIFRAQRVSRGLRADGTGPRKTKNA
jgi:Putative helix-turn-helix protein, YlxM / p13 like